MSLKIKFKFFIAIFNKMTFKQKMVFIKDNFIRIFRKKKVKHSDHDLDALRYSLISKKGGKDVGIK